MIFGPKSFKVPGEWHRSFALTPHHITDVGFVWWQHLERREIWARRGTCYEYRMPTDKEIAFLDRVAQHVDIDKLLGILLWIVLLSGIAAFIYWRWM